MIGIMFFFDIPSKIFGHEFGVIVINIEFVKSEKLFEQL